VIHDDPNQPRANFVADVIRRTRESGYAFPALHSHALAVAFPRSVDWETLDQSEFSPISAKVYTIIEEAIGISIEDLKENCQHDPTKHQATAD
jgi:hypothetical protein